MLDNETLNPLPSNLHVIPPSLLLTTHAIDTRHRAASYVSLRVRVEKHGLLQAWVRALALLSRATAGSSGPLDYGMARSGEEEEERSLIKDLERRTIDVYSFTKPYLR